MTVVPETDNEAIKLMLKELGGQIDQLDKLDGIFVK
jgi:hypothetical protein